MKKVLVGALCTLAVILVIRSCSEDREEKARLQESSALIQQQISNVAKIIVTEGHFAEVYNYKDSRQLFGPFISAEKKALVVVNAEVTVGYDLKQIQFEVDQATKTLYVKSIPKPEIKINPDFEYYDVQADYLNPFEARDYNTIKDRVNASLLEKVTASSMMGNAQNRLLSELSKFLILTNSLGWTLVYDDRRINSLEEIELID